MAFLVVLCFVVISPIFGFPCSTNEDGFVKRDPISDARYLWPSRRDNGVKTVVIPYTVLTGWWKLGSKEKGLIKQVSNTLKKKTCIRLVERSSQTDYIEFYKGDGCHSKIGRQGGKQQLSLGSNCDHYGIVMHEMLHALGFFHEQSRPDRDQYVKIFQENMKKGTEGQFKTWSAIKSFGFPYDFKSIMHYKNTAFSKNGLPTIQAKENSNMALGGATLSAGDVSQINILYGCPQKDIYQAEYEIKVFTKSNVGAGTNAKVYIDIYENDKKNTGEVHLKDGSFERGSVDTFKEALPYMSTLSKIDIRHDNTGWWADWDLDRVEIVIKHLRSEKKFTFSCNCELSGDSNTKTLKPMKS